MGREERPDPLARAEARIIYADGREEAAEAAVLAEHRLALRLNGESWKRVVCTRSDLRAMVVGQLYTEGRIGSPSDILELRFSPEEDRADIRLSPAAIPRRSPEGRMSAPTWERSWVFRLAARLQEGMPLHRETFAAHSAFLACGGTLLYAGEDISRHNAVDKAIGHGLLEGAALGQCMLFTTGRVPADMAEKAIAAGIPVLVSKSAPTLDAVRLAAACGLTLICCAREDSFTVF